MLVCAMLIRIADPGPAFHIQIREGRNGQPIGVCEKMLVPDDGAPTARKRPVLLQVYAPCPLR